MSSYLEGRSARSALPRFRTLAHPGHRRQTRAVSHLALQPGTVIDGYEVIELLGRGGMGAVYRVRRGSSDFALKTLALSGSIELAAEEILRFRREGELLASLSHPGIVRVRAAGSKPGFLYFIMQLVEGESLEARPKREGALAPEEAVRIAL